jgi:hypothetical protein
MALRAGNPLPAQPALDCGSPLPLWQGGVIGVKEPPLVHADGGLERQVVARAVMVEDLWIGFDRQIRIAEAEVTWEIADGEAVALAAGLDADGDFGAPRARQDINLKTELEPRISRINTDYQCLMKTESLTQLVDAYLHQILL